VVRVKKGADEIRLFKLSGKEIFFQYDETKSEENLKNNKKFGRCAKGVHVR